MSIEWIRDRYYTTRAGEKVRLICTDAPGDFPLIFLNDAGELCTNTLEGRHILAPSKSSLDITGPWVEPAKPLEYWVNVYPSGAGAEYSTEAEARAGADYGALRVAVHMREVMP